MYYRVIVSPVGVCYSVADLPREHLFGIKSFQTANVILLPHDICNCRACETASKKRFYKSRVCSEDRDSNEFASDHGAWSFRFVVTIIAVCLSCVGWPHAAQSAGPNQPIGAQAHLVSRVTLTLQLVAAFSAGAIPSSRSNSQSIQLLPLSCCCAVGSHDGPLNLLFAQSSALCLLGCYYSKHIAFAFLEYLQAFVSYRFPPTLSVQ